MPGAWHLAADRRWGAARYAATGEPGLEEQDRRARRHPNQTPAEIEQARLDLRREHPAWGPRKLQAKLEKAAPRLWRAGLTGGRGNVEITKSVIPLSA